MRLDFYLKVTRLVPRRSGSSDLCRDGKVTVNGQPGKAGRKVRAGDRLGIALPGREILVEVLGLPVKKSVSKVEAREFYTLLDEKRFDFWGREIKKDSPSPSRDRDDGGTGGSAGK